MPNTPQQDSVQARFQGVLGRYRLIRPLQAYCASLSVIRPQLYLAQSIQDNDQTLLVIKFLSITAGSTEQQQFLNEVRVLNDLNASGLSCWLPLHDSGRDTLIFYASGLNPEPMNYLVLPYIGYGSLKQALDTTTYSLKRVGQHWLNLLDCVEALHQHGWLHLDLKPSNILLKSASDIYLIDFALAQACIAMRSIAVRSPILTQTQGTPRYMSPEQFLGQTLDRQTDFYSLGLILYEMLTGKSIYSASSYQGWAVQHCQQPVPLLSQHLSGFQTLIDGLLTKNPHNRLADVDEIRQMAHYAFNDESYL